ncbi:unnamed protein product [Nezara viridula]|uniref:Uncharacterized protein n=1 Tax=Nezara viridula TaxID=85310 RepID=A0A9P0E4P5_NEZVI|nr:unnamed protein product [Nezara viridula]
MDPMRALGIVIDAAEGSWWFKDMPSSRARFSKESSIGPEQIAGIRRLEPEEAIRLDQVVEEELINTDNSVGLTYLTEHHFDVGKSQPIMITSYVSDQHKK